MSVNDIRVEGKVVWNSNDQFTYINALCQSIDVIGVQVTAYTLVLSVILT